MGGFSLKQWLPQVAPVFMPQYLLERRALLQLQFLLLGVVAQDAMVPVAMTETFKIRFDVAKITPLHEHTNEDGFFIVEVNRSWGPIGAERIWELVNEKVWDGSRFHHVKPKHH